MLHVLVCEEYGYRNWHWVSPFTTTKDLENWWTHLESVAPAFYNPAEAGWGGKWTEVNKLYLNCGLHYYIHVHIEDDSEMVTPAGEYLYHKGFTKQENK